MTAGVDLLVPIKPLHLAKSRLLGTTDRTEAHTELVTALAMDTVDAAKRAPGVRNVLVVTSDPRLADALRAEDVEVLADEPAAGLNAALRHGDGILRSRSAVRRVGALQGDLPALRPAQLGAAIAAAGDERAFCPDRQSTGTTLLLAETGHPLRPRFGPDSAEAHLASGAKRLDGPWDSLRCDVDTTEDLAWARTMGLGPRTSAKLF